HWRGIFQRDNNYVDGIFVTQCPIIPGESFTYQFQTSEQSGSYWYHADYKVQYCDGLRGPLVIYDLMIPMSVCMMSTIVRWTLGFNCVVDQPFHFRGHYYNTYRLVPLRFSTGSSGPVSIHLITLVYIIMLRIPKSVQLYID
ncbi:multicopper oxidase-domain-containing protein, partial [Lactarius deliciosus]